MSKDIIIENLSDCIFWDVDRNLIDPEANAPFVIQRVLEYGQLTDWKLILSYYGLERILGFAKQFRTLEPKALSFISTISCTPINQFRCYNIRHSIPEHSIF